MHCLLCGINTTEKKLSSVDLLTACAHLYTKKCVFRYEDYEEDENISNNNISNNASSVSTAGSNNKSLPIISHSDTRLIVVLLILLCRVCQVKCLIEFHLLPFWSIGLYFHFIYFLTLHVYRTFLYEIKIKISCHGICILQSWCLFSRLAKTVQ